MAINGHGWEQLLKLSTVLYDKREHPGLRGLRGLVCIVKEHPRRARSPVQGRQLQLSKYLRTAPEIRLDSPVANWGIAKVVGWPASSTLDFAPPCTGPCSRTGAEQELGS